MSTVRFTVQSQDSGPLGLESNIFIENKSHNEDCFVVAFICVIPIHKESGDGKYNSALQREVLG